MSQRAGPGHIRVSSARCKSDVRNEGGHVALKSPVGILLKPSPRGKTLIVMMNSSDNVFFASRALGKNFHGR